MVIMIASIGINYIFGLLLQANYSPAKRKLIASFAIFCNLVLLGFFKYTNWLIQNFLPYFPSLDIDLGINQPIHLPIGISFFTFQAISYLIDIYRRQNQAQTNPFSLGLYIASFPQLIAGPIVRYHDVDKQINDRQHSVALFASGVERFTYGLAKKVLIANPMGAMADQVFSLALTDMSSPTAWLGIICYALQIYYDFSGYSDMAIGLGRMFGFRFLENFNYPYIAQSIKEFWRRWHISLSGWFRDYLYIPLGGNRGGNWNTYFNLMLVFALCGLWHGASMNFLIWGLIHGFFLILERTSFGNWISKLPIVIRHLYTLFIVINAWVFFRVENLDSALIYWQTLYKFNQGLTLDPLVAVRLDSLFLTTFTVGVIVAMPVFPYLQQKLLHLYGLRLVLTISKPVLLTMLLLLAISLLATGAYNPFIYFRF